MLKLPVALELAAVVVGALSGGIHAVGRKADAVGTFSLALATGVGGGIIRDILIGAGPPAALRYPLYLPAVAAASALALLFASWLARGRRVLDVLDALLLGLWTVMGAERALAHGLPVVSAVFLGTVTATGGGALRDLLSGEAPAVFSRSELYVTASVLAGVIYVGLVRGAGSPAWIAELVTVGSAATIRLLALRWNITGLEPIDLPGWWRRVRDRQRGSRRG